MTGPQFPDLRRRFGSFSAFSKRRRIAALFAAAVSTIFGRCACASTDSWNDGTGNWSVGSNWLSGNVPAAGDTVNLTQSDAANRTVTFDAAATSGTGFAQLNIDATGPGSMSLYQALGTFNVSGTAYIGNSGTGSFVQTGGSNSVGTIQLGFLASANGSYTLSNNASLSAVSNEYIGNAGLGNFVQSGGTHAFMSISGSLYICFQSNGIGTYALSAGTLMIPNSTAVVSAPSEYIGYSGIGTFNQSGGTNSVGSPFSNSLYTIYNSLYIGFTNGASGTYTLSGTGYLFVAHDENIGSYNSTGTGNFNQTGGSNVLDGDLDISIHGSYSLSGGSMSANYESDAGVFNQTGGVSRPNQLDVDGTYLLSGTGVLFTAYSEQVPYTYGTSGAFIQSGGSNSTPNLNVGVSSIGAYTLSGNGSLTVSNAENVGTVSGTGTISQSGGVNSTGSLIIGYFQQGTGTYNLSGTGSLIVTGSESIGPVGHGMFVQSGGSNSTASLLIAYTNGSSGTYSLSGGVLSSGATTNGGQFTQSGGTATLGAVTGTGTMTLGGATELTSVTNFQQKTININSGGYLAVASNTTQYTNTATSLTITGSGRLDLANQYLLTTTSPSLVRQYLAAGYNGGAWNGTGGISSINAAANTNHATALGYTSGTSTVGKALGLATNQTLVKYTRYGDANLDGKVDINDLNIVLSNYLSTNSATWDTGDFNYDGKTDINDLNTLLSNYLAPPQTTAEPARASLAGAAQTLTSTASPDVTPPVPSSGQMELVVNTVTGDVELYGNNADIDSLQTTSAASIISANWHNMSSHGYSNWTNSKRPDNTQLSEYDYAFTGSGDYAAVTGMID